ncbi:unnamed protein product, partial [Ixodes pacificus]
EFCAVLPHQRRDWGWVFPQPLFMPGRVVLEIAKYEDSGLCMTHWVAPTRTDALTVGHVQHFGHLLEGSIHLGLCVVHVVSQVVQHDRLLVQLVADLLAHDFEAAHGRLDALQLLVLAHHQLLRRRD